MKIRLKAFIYCIILALSMVSYVNAEDIDNTGSVSSTEINDEVSVATEETTGDDATGAELEEDSADSGIYVLEEFYGSNSIVYAAETEAPSVEEVSLSLQGNICVNMVCNIPESVSSKAGAYVQVNEEKILISQLEKSLGKYIVSATVVPKDYDKTISVAFYTSSDNPINMVNTSGKMIDQYDMSIPRYIDAVMKGSYSSETKEVVENLKNYCNYTKTYFFDDAIISPSQSIQTAMNNINASALTQYKMTGSTSGSDSDIEIIGHSLLLKDSIILRFYFTIPVDRDINDYHFVMQNDSMTPVTLSGMYYIDCEPLMAAELKKVKQFEVYYGSSKVNTYTVYGAASYMSLAFEHNVDENLQNALKALYLFGEAVEKAQGKSAIVEEKISKESSIAYTGIDYYVSAVGQYVNWDGVSNVAEFVDGNGNYCFAYDGTDYITVVKCIDGQVKTTVSLQKQHSIFGNVICDSTGNYFVVTGENGSSDTTEETVFISKYDSYGNHIKTVGDNGRSSLAYYYNDNFNTCKPFDGGGCDVAINGKTLAVDYAREMYSGHQSNSVWAIDTDTMKTLSIGTIYDSHSFAQRAIPFGSGFVFMSHGDCYPRAFNVQYSNGKTASEKEIFHFWVREGALDDYDMWSLNPTYATMGDLAVLANNKVAFVASSAPDLNSNAKTQAKQIFVQIFDPSKKLTSADDYVTTGTRSGLGGPNGNISVEDYGVKWLTNDTSKTYKNPQAVSDGNNILVVLYEQYSGSTYEGVYYMVLDKEGNVISDAQLYSKTARLNSCQTPIWMDGQVCWTANQYGMGKKLYNYILCI